MAIVWPCPLDVESYAAAGRDVEIPRQACPDCGAQMIFWSGYERYVRSLNDTVRIWVCRAKCLLCTTSHALLPAFCLLKRLDLAEVIGAALARAATGAGVRTVAHQLGVPHVTARDWRRRFARRAAMIAAALQACALSFGSDLPVLSADPETAALQALGAAFSSARRRFGNRAPPLWCFASVVSGGELIATTTNPPWAGAGGRRLMPPTP